MKLTLLFQLAVRETKGGGKDVMRELSVTVDADTGCATTGSMVDIQTWCDADMTNRNCCTMGACANWSIDATYTICPGSCNGGGSCIGLAQNAAAGSTVKIGHGACVTPGGGPACVQLGNAATGAVAIDIGAGACVGTVACLMMLAQSTAVTTINIGAGACVGPTSCLELGLGAQVTATNIGAGSCVGEAACSQAAKASTATGVLTVSADTCKADNECAECAFDSVAPNLFLTTACCTAQTISLGASLSNTVCIPPSDFLQAGKSNMYQKRMIL